MPHLKFFQECCSLLIDQQRGQWWWHMLKNITWNAWMGLLSSEFVIFVSAIPVTSKWKSSSSNNNSTFSRLWLMLTILLWKMEKLDLTMFSGSFYLNNLMLCREKYRLWMRWLAKLYSAFMQASRLQFRLKMSKSYKLFDLSKFCLGHQSAEIELLNCPW